MNRFDTVFLSVDEPLADELFGRLCRVLGPAKRLHGVRPMRRAYQLCAQLADTEEFFLADGDFDIDPDFYADAIDPLAEGTCMRVWQARNPINGLTYGYGGLKLIRASALRHLGDAVDVLAALPGQVEFTGTPAGTTRIDQSPYHAWKAAFRECAMLARGCEYGATGHAAQQRRIDAALAAETPVIVVALNGICDASREALLRVTRTSEPRTAETSPPSSTGPHPIHPPARTPVRRPASDSPPRPERSPGSPT
ncbi:hypothetical protein LO762_09610 [Actinocorallia sp. API 0066]|uniref:hypothetical protein n=1 Tax=Actinocorallia sp. API 0066 TaxID=2896846 RepID=UPI001E48F197|nr:hypothetical protein [Actinocorallia sp. API 0066]MCD0449444.1 hypothetical protein [Actinocorallia sp. API 0066]